MFNSATSSIGQTGLENILLDILQEHNNSSSSRCHCPFELSPSPQLETWSNEGTHRTDRQLDSNLHRMETATLNYNNITLNKATDLKSTPN